MAWPSALTLECISPLSMNYLARLISVAFFSPHYNATVSVHATKHLHVHCHSTRRVQTLTAARHIKPALRGADTRSKSPRRTRYHLPSTFSPYFCQRLMHIARES